MNKVIFASIIAAVFVTGVVFAMYPVDQATTVHIVADRNLDIGAGSIVTGEIAADTIIAEDIAADGVGALELANDAVDTAAILDNAVTSAKVAGANTVGTALVAIDSGTGTAVTGVTSAFNPAISSQALVFCTWEGLVDTAAILAGIVTLTTGGDGLILGSAAHNFDEGIAVGDFQQGTDVWIVTTMTDNHVFTCTLSGAGVDTADIDNISTIALVVPE